jgi:hypothetical protein
MSIAQPKLPFVFDDELDKHYHPLKEGDRIQDGDTLIYPHEVYAVIERVNRLLPRSRYLTTAIGCRVAADETGGTYIYLRPVEPRPVAHVLVPGAAAITLLELWFGKYSITCDDGEEAAAWQKLKEALHPETKSE